MSEIGYFPGVVQVGVDRREGFDGFRISGLSTRFNGMAPEAKDLVKLLSKHRSDRFMVEKERTPHVSGLVTAKKVLDDRQYVYLSEDLVHGGGREALLPRHTADDNDGISVQISPEATDRTMFTVIVEHSEYHQNQFLDRGLAWIGVNNHRLLPTLVHVETVSGHELGEIDMLERVEHAFESSEKLLEEAFSGQLIST